MHKLEIISNIQRYLLDERVSGHKNTYSSVWTFFGLKKIVRMTMNWWFVVRTVPLCWREEKTQLLCTGIWKFTTWKNMLWSKSTRKRKLAEGSGNFGNSGQQITLGQVIKGSKPYSCGSQDRKRSLISHTIPSNSQDFVVLYGEKTESKIRSTV